MADDTIFLKKLEETNLLKEKEEQTQVFEMHLERLKKEHPNIAKSAPQRLENIAAHITDNEEKKQNAQAKLKSEPTTLKELKEVLKAEGELWRAEHTEVNETTGKVKIPPMTARNIADIMERHIKFIVIGNNAKELERSQVYSYDLASGIYTPFRRVIEKLSLLVDRSTRISTRKDLLDLLRLEAEEKELTTDYNLVPVNNGIYDRITKRLVPFSPDYIFIAKIGTNYNPDAKEPDFKGWSLSGWIEEVSRGDENKKRLIWQTVASAINANFIQPYMFFLTDDGQGRTGKSTFEQFLMNLVGSGNYESLKLIEFENDFKVANAIGSALIIGDDNHPGDFNEKSEMLKSMVTGDIVLINPKGIPPFTAQSTALIVQSMNGLPKFQDTTGGLTRRIKVIKFNHQYPDTPAGRLVKDRYIKDKGLLEYALKEALEIDITNLADTEESKAEVKRIREESNPVAYFVSKYWDDLESERIPTRVAFEYFLRVMKEENRPSSMGQPAFTRALQKELPEGWEYSSSMKMNNKQFLREDLDRARIYDPKYNPWDGTKSGFMKM